jgi:hypothetical protein
VWLSLGSFEPSAKKWDLEIEHASSVEQVIFIPECRDGFAVGMFEKS